MGTQIYGDGTGNSNKDFLGLAAIVDDVLLCRLMAHNLVLLTHLQVYRYASSGTLTLKKCQLFIMLLLLVQSIRISESRTEAVFSFYEQLLVPQERINKDNLDDEEF